MLHKTGSGSPRSMMSVAMLTSPEAYVKVIAGRHSPGILRSHAFAGGLQENTAPSTRPTVEATRTKSMTQVAMRNRG
jgi:hypothetical protein